MSKSVARRAGRRIAARWEDRLLSGSLFDRHIGAAIKDARAMGALPARGRDLAMLPDSQGLNMCSVDSTTTCPSTTWCQSTTACPSTTNCKSVQTCVEPQAVGSAARIWPASIV